MRFYGDLEQYFLLQEYSSKSIVNRHEMEEKSVPKYELAKRMNFTLYVLYNDVLRT